MDFSICTASFSSNGQRYSCSTLQLLLSQSFLDATCQCQAPKLAPMSTWFISVASPETRSNHACRAIPQLERKNRCWLSSRAPATAHPTHLQRSRNLESHSMLVPFKGFERFPVMFRVGVFAEKTSSLLGLYLV